MADVFISYKSQRRGAVEHLARVLECHGYTVWFDQNLTAGEEFGKPIERELRTARAVIVLWCNLSVASDWVREEAQLAKRLRCIIPARLERVDVPLGFATLHTIDLSRWDGAPRSHTIDRLLLEVARLVGRDPVPDMRALIEFDQIWRRSGGLPFAQLAHTGAPAAGISRGAAPAMATAVPPLAAGLVAAPAQAPKPGLGSVLSGGAASLWRLLGATRRAAEPSSRQPAAPALPDRPSLVVLPFANRSDDPEQDYFADGMTEELTAGLSRIRWLFVIARNSAFAVNGPASDARAIGRELGVRYILEGSVRKAGSQVRIAGRLVDSETGQTIWADRFDGELAGIFDLQDRVTEAVVGSLEPTLRAAEIERSQRKPVGNLDAYDLFLRALPQYHKRNEAGSVEAQTLLRRALALSPGFAPAAALFAACQVRRQAEGWAKENETAEAVRLAREAAATAPQDPTVLTQAALALAYLDHAHGEAQAMIARAAALCPNSALVEGGAGLVHVYGCQPEPAIRHLQRAIRLSPLDPWMGSFLLGIAIAHQIAGRLDEALEVGQAALRAAPDFGALHRVVVATLAMMGRVEEARAAAAELRRQAPAAFHVFADSVRARNPDKAFAGRLIDAYRAAGLPE